MNLIILEKCFDNQNRIKRQLRGFFIGLFDLFNKKVIKVPT